MGWYFYYKLLKTCFLCSVFFCNVHLYIFSQANKTGKSYKVPLSTFYVEEIISAVQPAMDVTLWKELSEVEVKTYSTLYITWQCFRGTVCPEQFEFIVGLLITEIISW